MTRVYPKTFLYATICNSRFNKHLTEMKVIIVGVIDDYLFVLYGQVDVRGWRSPTIILEWLGQNAMLMYVLFAEGVFIAAVQGLYVGSPENNLVIPSSFIP